MSQERNAEKDAASEDWTVGVVAVTTEGEHVLRMTQEQAESLRSTLNFLMGDDEVTPPGGQP